LGLRSTSLRNLTEMWRILRPAGMLEIFLASRQGELLGGLGVWQHAGVVVEWGSVQSERARVEKLYCSDLLKWEVIRWGHGRGYRLYDLAGVAPDPDRADPKKRGIYQFKAKWGGRYRESQVFFKPLKPLRHKILKLGSSLARKLLG
ncbi:MAG: GNAT family N-acetyltransferase, partial [Candidatus Glassbacteria bacterium]|nr:GNAT family N-acetyltransferase [Candidatus Glassbacteria bacterium]